MITASPASFVLSDSHSVFAAKNGTKTTSSSSSSSSKGSGGSTNNSTSPIGSSTFLKVITKVDNTKGGTKTPSDFTITVSGKNPSPKSFSGSSSGTSVTLKAGKYKVTGSGPSGYNIAYSSGCSGIANGGVPVKCTISPSFSTPTPGGSNSTSTTTKTKGGLGKFHFIIIDKANHCTRDTCPALNDLLVKIRNMKTNEVQTLYPRLGENHYYVDFPIGEHYRLEAMTQHPGGWCVPGTRDQTSCFFWDGVNFITPPYSGQVCGEFGFGNCNGIMPPGPGPLQVEVDAYYASP